VVPCAAFAAPFQSFKLDGDASSTPPSGRLHIAESQAGFGKGLRVCGQSSFPTATSSIFLEEMLSHLVEQLATPAK
jgi:hypothetical protein